MKTILLSEKYEAKNNPQAKINNNIDGNGPAKTNRTNHAHHFPHTPPQGPKSKRRQQKSLAVAKVVSIYIYIEQISANRRG